MDLKFRLSDRQQFRNITTLYSAAPDSFKTTETCVSTGVHILCVFGSKILRPPSCQHFLFCVTEHAHDDTPPSVTQSGQKTSFAQLISRVQTNDLPSAYSLVPPAICIRGVKLPTRNGVVFFLFVFSCVLCVGLEAGRGQPL